MANEVRAAMLQTRWTGDKESMIQIHEEYLAEAAAARRIELLAISDVSGDRLDLTATPLLSLCDVTKGTEFVAATVTGGDLVATRKQAQRLYEELVEGKRGLRDEA